MNRGRVINLQYLNSTIIFLKHNWCLLMLTASFIIGLFVGTFVLEYNEKLLGLINNYTQNFFNIRFSGSFAAVFINSYIWSFVFLLLGFIFGTSVIGVSILPVILASRGVMFGGLATLIYAEHSFKGIAFNALVLIPPAVISVVVLIIAAKESVNFSLLITKMTFPDYTPSNLNFAFKRYCIKYAAMFACSIVSSLLDGWLSVKLVAYFNLI